MSASVVEERVTGLAIAPAPLLLLPPLLAAAEAADTVRALALAPGLAPDLHEGAATDLAEAEAHDLTLAASLDLPAHVEEAAARALLVITTEAAAQAPDLAPRETRSNLRTSSPPPLLRTRLPMTLTEPLTASQLMKRQPTLLKLPP